LQCRELTIENEFAMQRIAMWVTSLLPIVVTSLLTKKKTTQINP